MSTVDEGPILNWLKTLLEQGTNRPIGDGVAPIVNPSKTGFPYSIIYSLPGGSSWGGFFAQPDANSDVVFQVSSFGLRKDSARFQNDAVRRTICARQANGDFQVQLQDPAPYSIADRVMGENGPPDEDETQFTPEVYTFSQRYTIRVTQGD